MPPILDNVDELLLRYVTAPQIPIHRPTLFVLPRKPAIERLYEAPAVVNAGSTISVQRDARTNAIIGYHETSVADAENNATNSTSLRRAAGRPEQATRGSAVNYPFWPGGFEEPEAADVQALLDESVNFQNDLLVDAPGFPYGVDFESDQYRRQVSQYTIPYLASVL